MRADGPRADWIAPVGLSLNHGDAMPMSTGAYGTPKGPGTFAMASSLSPDGRRLYFETKDPGSRGTRGYRLVGPRSVGGGLGCSPAARPPICAAIQRTRTVRRCR